MSSGSSPELLTVVESSDDSSEEEASREESSPELQKPAVAPGAETDSTLVLQQNGPSIDDRQKPSTSSSQATETSVTKKQKNDESSNIQPSTSNNNINRLNSKQKISKRQIKKRNSIMKKREEALKKEHMQLKTSNKPYNSDHQRRSRFVPRNGGPTNHNSSSNQTNETIINNSSYNLNQNRNLENSNSTNFQVREFYFSEPVPFGPYGVLYNKCLVSSCSLNFSDREAFVRHLATDHDLWSFQCLVGRCGTSFATSNSLDEHLEEAHRGISRWQCSKCPAVYRSHYQLWRHDICVHYEGRFTCVRCDHFTADTRLEVILHYNALHHPEADCPLDEAGVCSLHQQPQHFSSPPREYSPFGYWPDGEENERQEAESGNFEEAGRGATPQCTATTCYHAPEYSSLRGAQGGRVQGPPYSSSLLSLPQRPNPRENFAFRYTPSNMPGYDSPIWQTPSTSRFSWSPLQLLPPPPPPQISLPMFQVTAGPPPGLLGFAPPPPPPQPFFAFHQTFQPPVFVQHSPVVPPPVNTLGFYYHFNHQQQFQPAPRQQQQFQQRPIPFIGAVPGPTSNLNSNTLQSPPPYSSSTYQHSSFNGGNNSRPYQASLRAYSSPPPAYQRVTSRPYFANMQY